jgi:hypothetical protein
MMCFEKKKKVISKYTVSLKFFYPIREGKKKKKGG